MEARLVYVFMDEQKDRAYGHSYSSSAVRVGRTLR